MKNFLLISALILATNPIHSMDSFKQQAYFAIKDFFQLKNQALVLNGQYIATPSEFGKTCRITIDFTQTNSEYFAISGEFTPITKVGDGIFFSAAKDTFTDFSYQNGHLIIEQIIADSFSTWTKNTLELHTKQQNLFVTLQQTNSFLFFTDSIKKQCVVMLDKKK